MKIVFFSFLTFLVLPSVFAQDMRPEQARVTEEIQRQRERQVVRNERNGIDRQGMIAGRDNAATRIPLYKNKGKELKELRKSFERTRHLLIVPDSYYENYKVSLKDKRIELARLQPDKGCYGDLLVSVEEVERCADVPPIPGGGSLYSFRSKLNYPKSAYIVRTEDDVMLVNKKPSLNFSNGGIWWNLHFVNDSFAVENSSVRGIISEIGEVNLERLELSAKEFDFLNKFKIKTSEAETRQQNQNLRKGIRADNFIYSNSAPVKLNSTYVLRSIDYSSEKKARSGKADKSADMLIALKVVGLENDGSVIILWKELKKDKLKKN